LLEILRELVPDGVIDRAVLGFLLGVGGIPDDIVGSISDDILPHGILKLLFEFLEFNS
jgi:hypothetical protein